MVCNYLFGFYNILHQCFINISLKIFFFFIPRQYWLLCLGSLFLLLLEYRYIVNFSILIFTASEFFLMLNGQSLRSYTVILLNQDSFDFLSNFCTSYFIFVSYCFCLRPPFNIKQRQSDGELPYFTPDCNGYQFFLFNSVIMIMSVWYCVSDLLIIFVISCEASTFIPFYR